MNHLPLPSHIRKSHRLLHRKPSEFPTMIINGGRVSGSGSVHCFLSLLFISLASFCGGVTRLPQGQFIRDMINETLLSSREVFELGFFSPQGSTLRYVWIWYHEIEGKEIVWITNRNTPLNDRNGAFRVEEDANLVVLDGNRVVVCSSNVSASSRQTTATLLDTENLVLSSSDSFGDTSKASWQSFDHPTDNYLPGMRVCVNSALGENRVFISWKSTNDPSLWNFTVGVDPNEAPQIVIWDKGRRRWRSGQWNGAVFTDVPEMSGLASYLFGFKLSLPKADGSMYVTYLPSKGSKLLRFCVDWKGIEEKLLWDENRRVWTMLLSQPTSKCEFYNYCGDFGTCKHEECSCLVGFEPKFANDWSDGCVRREKLQCQRNDSGVSGNGEPDEFKELRNVKLADFSIVVPLDDSQSCRTKCLGNCSCSAFADITGIGCMIGLVRRLISKSLMMVEI